MAATERVLPARRGASPFPGEGAAVAPFQFPLDGNEYLRASMVSAVAGAVVAIQGRLLRPSGEIANFAFTLRSLVATVMEENDYQLGAGALLSVFAQPAIGSGGTAWGDTYAALSIVRGQGVNAVELGVLIQSYVGFKQPAVWPGTPIRASLDGNGRPEVLAFTDPAAGFPKVINGTGGARYRLSVISASFVTDATLGSRFVNLLFRRNGTLVARFWAPAAQAPSTGVNYYFVAGGASYVGGGGSGQYTPLPRALWFDATDEIELTWAGTVGAADQLSAIAVDADRWLIPFGVGSL